MGFYCVIISCLKHTKPTYTHNLDESFMGDPQLECHGILCLFNIGHCPLVDSNLGYIF